MKKNQQKVKGKEKINAQKKQKQKILKQDLAAPATAKNNGAQSKQMKSCGQVITF